MQLTAEGIALIGYMAVLLGIGVFAARRASDEAAFLLGGRTLGPWVAGLAYAASTSSAWVLLGFSGFVAVAGVSALWMIPGILAGYALVWLWLGPWLNETARRDGSLTALDMLAADADGAMRRLLKAVAAAMIVFCFAFYIAAQFQGAGAALARVFGIDTVAALVVGAAIILVYTFLGGFWAVSLTDTLQGLSILAVALVLPVAALAEVGGWAGLMDGLAPGVQPSPFSAPFGAYAGWSALGFVFGLSAIGIGALGQPHLLTWVMAVRDRKARLQGAAVALGWGALVYAGMAIVGLSARIAAGGEAALGENLVFDLAARALPGFLPALVSAAILSAIMSTVDAQLLTASAAASRDLGLERIGANSSIALTRAMIVLLAVAAVALTLLLPASIFDRVLFAWTALGAAFGPTIVARAAGRRPPPIAVLLAIIAGFTLAVAFNQFLPSGPGAWRERILPWLAGLALVFIWPQPHQRRV